MFGVSTQLFPKICPITWSPPLTTPPNQNPTQGRGWSEPEQASGDVWFLEDSDLIQRKGQ